MIPRALAASIAIPVMAWALTSSAQEVLTLTGEVASGDPDHQRIPFEVGPGVVEIEVAHDDLSEENILDWGLEDPNGFRGWGGGNEEPAVVGIDAASRSYLPGPIPEGTWNVVIGKAKIAETPAQYDITVTLRDAASLAPQPERQPYEPVTLAAEARWYAGDFHVHSRESGDANATLDAILDLAAERGLDFVVITDHNTVSHLDFFADAQARHPNVLLIPGIEVTTYDGHYNAIGATAFVEHKIGLDGATIEDAAAQTHDQGALFSINHPSFDLGDLCIGCAWKHDLEAAQIDAIEIATMGAGNVLLFATLQSWESLLATGRHVAALGGSDDHRAGVDPGTLGTPIGSPTTLVYAEELSPAGILAGIQAGRTQVLLDGPEDPAIDLRTDPPLSGDTASGATVLVRATVEGGTGNDLVIVADGEPIATVAIDADPFTFEHELTPPASGEVRVRAEVAAGSQTHTITSHVWLTTGPPRQSDDGGCACVTAGRATRANAHSPWWWLVLTLMFRRRTAPRARERACTV